MRSGPGWAVVFTGTHGAVQLGSWIQEVTLTRCPLHTGVTLKALAWEHSFLPAWELVSLEKGFFFPSAGQGPEPWSGLQLHAGSLWCRLGRVHL